MASNTEMMKFHRHFILRPAKCTQIYNLAHYEKRLDTPGLDDLNLFLTSSRADTDNFQYSDADFKII